MFDGFPSLEIPAIKTLALYKQWVLWRHEIVEGKLTKVPYRTDHFKASTTNSTTWSRIDAAYEAALKHDGTGYTGVGFVFSATAGNRIMGIDLDKCRDERSGEIEEEAQQIIDRFNSYTEISPSGRGVHILCLGALPPGSRRRLGRLEMYDTGRFFTVSGNHLKGTPEEIVDCQEAVEWFSQYLDKKKDGTSRPVPHRQSSTPTAHAHTLHANGATLGVNGHAPTDDGLIELLEPHAVATAMITDRKMLEALLQNSERFAETWSHKRAGEAKDWSASEYDMALANFFVAADWSPLEIMRGLIEHRVRQGYDLKLNRNPRCDYYVRTIRSARRQRRQTDAQDVVRAAASASEGTDAVDKDSVLEALTVVFGCQIKGVKRYSGDEVTVVIETTKGEIRASSDSLLSQGRMRALFLSAAKIVVPKTSAGNHDKRVQALVDIADEIDTGPDANISELIKGWLIDWLAAQEVSEELNIHDANRPFMRDGVYWVSTSGFSKWLKDQRGVNFTPQKLALELRKLQCAPREKEVVIGNGPRAKKGRRQFWSVAPYILG